MYFLKNVLLIFLEILVDNIINNKWYREYLIPILKSFNIYFPCQCYERESSADNPVHAKKHFAVNKYCELIKYQLIIK